MSEMAPSISIKKRISPLWIIPVVALIAGVWMVVQSYLEEGPTIKIHFATAEGLQEGKTRIKVLNVNVGLVELVTLKEDVSGITATVSLDKEVTPLLGADTQFWVVRARVGAGGVSGLSTILSGAFIEMSPGTEASRQREFTGLETPPVTAQGSPGLRLKLTSEHASINAGDAILYRGFKVGRVETMTFDSSRRQATYEVFINAPYDELVDSSTRFWDTSGVSLDASAEGIQVHVGSLDTLIAGGVAFGKPPDLPRGVAVDNNTEFRLYRSYNNILKNPYKHGIYYVVSFGQSVGGLVPGALVSFRGIQIGRVIRVLLKEMNVGAGREQGAPIPILIYLEPGRLEIPDSPASVELMRTSIEDGVKAGLRASVETANLLTGRQKINFDFFPDAEPATMSSFDNYSTLPTVERGVARLETQVSMLLAKINALPIETTVANANDALKNIDGATAKLQSSLASINTMLETKSAQNLPDDVAATLIELRSVLDGFSQDAEIYQSLNATMNSLNDVTDNLDTLIRELSDKPNSVLFPIKPTPDPIPEARP